MAPRLKMTDFRSDKERLLAQHLHERDIHFEHDYRFHKKRRFLIDFAIVLPKIAIEVEGIASHRKTRHQTFIGYMNDCEKYNLLVAGGWRLLRIPTPWIGTSRFHDKFLSFLDQLEFLIL